MYEQEQARHAQRGYYFYRTGKQVGDYRSGRFSVLKGLNSAELEVLGLA